MKNLSVFVAIGLWVAAFVFAGVFAFRKPVCVLQLGSLPTPPPSSSLDVPKAVQGQRFDLVTRGRGRCVDLSKYKNYQPSDNVGCIGESAGGESTQLWDIEVLRDRDSGMEFICAFADHQLSCFATGRFWKEAK